MATNTSIALIDCFLDGYDGQPVYDPSLQKYVVLNPLPVLVHWLLQTPVRKRRIPRKLWKCAECGYSWQGKGQYRNARIHCEIMSGHHIVEEVRVH